MDICNEKTYDNEAEMSIVIVGHVDHGKSTVIGRLLADTNSLPQGKLEQIKEMCRRNSKPFEYAFLLDALKDERSQGITIDTARCFFKTEKRKYIIIDAPGHIEFLKNMITGASRAEAALLVIDAHEGIRENSRRHGYILSMLGVKQVAVLVNKLDLIDYSEAVYSNIVSEYGSFLSRIGVTPSCFIPVSAAEGDNIALHSEKMSWYTGNTVLEQLDCFREEENEDKLPFRMSVQDVYKFTSDGDDRRIIAGTIDTGTLHTGDNIMFWPSGKKTTVKTIESFNRPATESAEAGQATGFTMTEEIYTKRGELAAKENQPQPLVSCRIGVSLFWLGREPFTTDRQYFLKIGSAKVRMTLEGCSYVLNAATLEKTHRQSVERYEVAQCVLKTEKPIAFDLAHDCAATSRFVIVDKYEISGGGIITDTADRDETSIPRRVIKRDTKWEKSAITQTERAERYAQKSAAVIITGDRSVNKKTFARALEKKLFSEGRLVYYIGIGNILYGLDSDIKTDKNRTGSERAEHIRRLAEVVHLMCDAGIITVVTASGLTPEDMEIFSAASETETVTVRVGDDGEHTGLRADVSVPEKCSAFAETVKEELKKRGIIFSSDKN